MQYHPDLSVSDDDAIEEAWSTDDDLVAAFVRFANEIRGFVLPAAYGLARVDGPQLVFAHVNGIGGTHWLPAVVLASVCGHVSGTATYDLSRQDVDRAVQLLAPAEAATHVDHPNLWSWRTLVQESRDTSRFVAFFVDDIDHEPVNDDDRRFRQLLGRDAPQPKVR